MEIMHSSHIRSVACVSIDFTAKDCFLARENQKRFLWNRKMISRNFIVEQTQHEH